MPLSDYQKAKTANERRITKQREKQNSPEYKAKQLAKQREAAERQRQRQLDRRQVLLADPEFRHKQLDMSRKQQTSLKAKAPMEQSLEQQEEQIHKQLQRQRLAQAAQLEKQKQKLASPEYRQQQQEKYKAAVERQRDRQLDRMKKQDLKTKEKLQKKPRKALKNRGMKGRGRTARERILENKLASLGCICCFNQGWYTTLMNSQEGQYFISMHHVDGRTKAWCHAKQLPLCQYHHDTPPPLGAPKDLFPLHGTGRKLWEAINGTQESLLKQAYEMIGEPQPWLEETVCIEVDD